MFKKENLRKNFLRVKQNIDQNLGRAEKSEVLSEDQQENEKRVDVVKHAFQNISKKALVTLQAPGSDFDKRLKKLPETGLGNAMIESAQGLGAETLLGSSCLLCGECQINLAKERLQFETCVEQDFVVPLHNIVEVEIPCIVKYRKALNKSCLDMDSAKSRYQQAIRQSTVAGVNIANAAAKVDVIKEELEEASSKVENIKDNLSIELCNFAAKESDHTHKLLMFLEAQANYHMKALEAIQVCLPQLRVSIQNSPAKPIYGMLLDEHLRLMCRDIAIVLEECILALLEIGIEEEGLFRIAGSAIKLKKLKASFDARTLDMDEYMNDPHTVAGALKQYLRELPEPLLTYTLHDEFMLAANTPHEFRLEAIRTVINKLPTNNYNNFRYLIKFLSKLKEKSDVNKMKSSNIAIVIGPNLLWSKGSDSPSMLTTGTLSSIIEAIVSNSEFFFPGEIDFTNVGCRYEEIRDKSPIPIQVQGVDNQILTNSNQQYFNSGMSSPVSTNSSSSSLPVPLEDSPEVSSPVQRRLSKKPAPPPPPERPFTVMVTAATTPVTKPDGDSTGGIGDAGNPFQTWPRSAPLASPEFSTEAPEKQEKHRSSHSERPSIPPPERPRLPPPVTIVPGRGHQRSASTGAMLMSNAGGVGGDGASGIPNAGTVSSYNIASSGEGSASADTAQITLSSLPAGASLGRSTSFRPRNTPPPPPPISKECENTKL